MIYGKRLGVTLVLFGMMHFPLLAQQVISTAGNQSTSQSGVSLEWTMGQVIFTTVSADSLVLTQGFHQPTLEIITSLSESNWEGLIHVYPNPTTERIFLSSSSPGIWHYRLINANGQPLLEEAWSGITREVSLAAFPAGYYLLMIMREDKVVYRTGIIKNK